MRAISLLAVAITAATAVTLLPAFRDASAQTSAPATGHLGYRGEWHCPDGTLYLRGRMYHPGMRRFLQRDPAPGDLATPMSLNRYAYAESNPATWADPSGFSPAKGFSSTSFIGQLVAPKPLTVPKPVTLPPTGLTPIVPPVPLLWPTTPLGLPQSLPESEIDKVVSPDRQEHPCGNDEVALWRFTDDRAGLKTPLFHNYKDGPARRRILGGANSDVDFRQIAGWCHTRGMTKQQCLAEFTQAYETEHEQTCGKYGAAACSYRGSPFLSTTEDPANFMTLEWGHGRSSISMRAPYLVKMCVPRSRVMHIDDLWSRFGPQRATRGIPIAVPEREVLVRCPAGNCKPYEVYRAPNPFRLPTT